MKLLKYIIISTLSVCVLLSCCACNSNNNNDNINFYEQLKFEDSDIISGVVTENDKYLLSWDADNACIKLIEKKTNKIWSSTPMTADGNYVEDINNIYSPINIEYIRKSAYRTIELTGKVGAVNNGRIYAENITDGIKLTFMFDELSIAITVNFTLNDKGLSVNVKTSDIVENPKGRKRNLTDEQIRLIKERNGIIGLNFCRNFLESDGFLGIDSLVRQIDYFLSLGCENNIALGSDYDGCSIHSDFAGVEKLFSVYNILAEKGYSRELLDKIFYENAHRFFSENL